MRIAAFVICAAVLAGCSTAPQTGSGGAYRFFVVGDTPYDEADAAMLATATDRMRAAKPAFVIHVGDIKSGGAPCDGEADDAFSAWIEKMRPATVFYTPGDNEWTDCDRNNDPATGAPYSELGRLDLLRSRFFSTPPTGAERFGWRNQQGHPENATWKDRNVRFATVHAVGTADGWGYVGGDPLDLATESARSRDAAAVAWIGEAAATAKTERADALVIAMQADPTETRKFAGVRCEAAVEDAYACDAFVDLRAALRGAAATFGGPVLLVHGDTAPFTLDQNLLESGAPNLWRLNAAGDAGVDPSGAAYGVRDVTVITVAPPAARPFAAQGLLTGRPAADH